MVCNGQLTGIVSGGEGCAFPRLPGVYSSVFYFEDWILKNMNVTSYAQNVSDVVISNAKQSMRTSALLPILLFLNMLT